VTRLKSAFAALSFLAATIATPCAAQQSSSVPAVPASGTCSGCFAYLEFPPSEFEDSDVVRQGDEFTSSTTATEPGRLVIGQTQAGTQQ
jgi:hypothetical protein